MLYDPNFELLSHHHSVVVPKSWIMIPLRLVVVVVDLVFFWVQNLGPAQRGGNNGIFGRDELGIRQDGRTKVQLQVGVSCVVLGGWRRKKNKR